MKFLKLLNRAMTDMVNYTWKEWCVWLALVCFIGWFLFAVYDGFMAAAGYGYKANPVSFTEEYIKYRE